MKKLLMGLALAAVMAAPARALDLSPLQIGLWGPNAQLFPPETEVIGLRLNLARSDNLDVTGLDVGLVSRARRMNAVQVNLANVVEAEFAGLGAGLYNRAGSLAGLQAGLFNQVDHDVGGFQLGLFNAADDVTGFQIGFLNRTVSLRGVQIGLVNINEGGPATFFPIVNAAF